MSKVKSADFHEIVCNSLNPSLIYPSQCKHSMGTRASASVSSAHLCAWGGVCVCVAYCTG